MFKLCLRPALLVLLLLLSLSASALVRAQDSTPKSFEAAQVTMQTAQQQGTHARVAQQQQQQQPSTSQQQQGASPPAPLTAKQKMGRSFRSAFLSPVPYLVSAFNAGMTQMTEDRLPHKQTDDEMADWGSRTARTFATRTTSTLFGGGVYPMLFKQDPRYEPSQSKKFGRRMLHSVSRVFVTRDDEGNLEPNYSRFAGSMTASATANIWEHSTPGRDRVGPDATMRRFARTFLDGAITNILFREFGPDIIGIFRR